MEGRSNAARGDASSRSRSRVMEASVTGVAAATRAENTISPQKRWAKAEAAKSVQIEAKSERFASPHRERSKAAVTGQKQTKREGTASPDRRTSKAAAPGLKERKREGIASPDRRMSKAPFLGLTLEPGTRPRTNAVAKAPKQTVSLSVGKEKLIAKEFQAALDEFDVELANNSKLGRAATLADRAKAKQALGRLEDSLLDCNDAISLEPFDVSLRLQRGDLRRLMGQVTEAVADFDSALELDTNNAKALHLRGISRVTSRDYAKALVDLDKALAIEPKFAKALAGRGSVKLLMGHQAEALLDLDAASKFDSVQKLPAVLALLQNRGCCLQEMGRYAEAAADYEETLLRLKNEKVYQKYQKDYHQAAANLRAVESKTGDFALRFVVLGGFMTPDVNSKFKECRTREFRVNDREIYLSECNKYFLYFSKKEGNSGWKCGELRNLPEVQGGVVKACLGCSPTVELISELRNKGWWEWWECKWVQRANGGVEKIGCL